MNAQTSDDIGEDAAGQKRQGTGESDGLPFVALAPDFRVGVTPINPITGEKPVCARRDDTGADDDGNESRPVHAVLPINTQALYSYMGGDGFSGQWISFR